MLALSRQTLQQGLRSLQGKTNAESGKLATDVGVTGRQRQQREPEINATYDYTSRLPEIKVLIGQQECIALIDPAATANLINTANLPRDQRVKPTERRLNLASKGAQLNVTGETWLPISIQERNFKLQALVTSQLRHTLVLGLPWLEEEQAILDVTRKVLYIGKDSRVTVPLLRTSPKSGSSPLINRENVQHGLKDHEQHLLFETLQEHAGVFSPASQGLPQTRTIKHEIRVTSTQPFRLPMYRYSDEKRAIIEQQVQEMLADGIIEQTSSPYSSPIVLARKKDGKSRFCVDYQKLNSLTEDYPQPIPSIPDALKDLGNAKVFSTLDLKSGYWQIPMEPASKRYTAFATPSGGSYQFRVMPFGLKGTPGTFQRLMSQEVLTGYLGRFCLVYVDDIIVYSNNLTDHMQHLALVLE